MVRVDFPNVDLIVNSENTGYAAGNNLALAKARGDYILLLNPDIVINPDTLSNAVALMECRAEVGALGCKLVSTDGSTQSSVRSFPDPLPILFEVVGLARAFPKSRLFGKYRMTYLDYNATVIVDQPMGSFLLIRRRTFEEVGPLDKDFPIFFNDVDWCYRAVRENHWKILYTGTISVLHYGGSSTKQAKATMVSESHQSFVRFYRKHYLNRIPQFLFWTIEKAVSLNERRILTKLSRHSVESN